MVTRARLLALMGSLPLAARPLLAKAESPLRMGATASESFVEAYFLLDGGFANRAGLTCEVMPFTNGAQQMQAISGGSLDIGMSDMTQVANAQYRGLPFAFFAGGSVYRTDAPATLLCVAKDSPLRSVKDLEGKTVGLNGLRTLAEISTRETVRLAGGDPSKVSFVEISPSLAVPALLRGTVAAAIVSEPFITLAGTDIRRFAKPYDAVAKSFYINGWFAKQSWLSENAATARKLTQAIYDAARWTNGHHDESAPVLVKYLKLDPEKTKNLTRATFATSLDPKLMQPVLDIAAKYGLLEKPVDAKTLIAKT
ncbi:MAG TPA: ABC transporter substrate-binding protein [Candidatus Acidoferrales bacterium]|nr:ABC transporter substrate-binding protein [Candidatus Acidoferrales bacterium]